MSSRTTIIWTILFLFSCEMIFAQSAPALPNVIPPSPDAQALGKFGDIPVGKFTGIPDISIPVYEIKIGDYTLPISLRYHASGVKVEEVASSVGIGWALDAGGTISQAVYGGNDLEGQGYPASSFRLPGHAFTSPISFDPDFSDGGYDYDYARKVADGTSDSQPDLFYYSFGSFSGKFYIDQDGQVHTIPFDPIKIQYNIPSVARYKITDKNGNQYFFASAETSTTTELCGVSVGGSTYLDKIVLNNHDSIVFEYETTSYSYPIHSSAARAVLMPGETSIGEQLVSNHLDCYGNNAAATVDVVGIRLKRITSSRGHVIEFTYSDTRDDLPSAGALTSIAIKFNTTRIKTYSLYQSYFGAGSGAPETKRLKLDSVIMGDYVHRFYYNSIALPNRISFAQDHWGFYNGQTTNTTLLPLDLEKGFTDGANREVDTNYVKAGILEKIVYPTGGYTLFDYEPNDYHFTGTQNTFTNQAQFLAGAANSTTTKSFTIPASPVQILNATATLISNPLAGLGDLSNPGADVLCTIQLTGDNGYSNSWTNQNSPVSGFGLTLTPGNYTMTVTTNGDYDNTYINIQYQEDRTEEVNRNDFIGGLRIKTITSYTSDVDPAPRIKTYKYTLPDNSGYSSGQINFMPTYISGITYTQTTVEEDDNGESVGALFSYHNYWRQSSSPVFSLGTIHGGSVGYLNVEEWEGANAENGKTISKFSFLGDGGGSSWAPMVPTVSRDWNSGYLLEEGTYKNNGGVFSLIQQKDNFYSDHSESEYWNAHYDPSTFNSNDYLRGWGVNIIYKHPEYIFGTLKLPAEFYWNDYHLISRWVRLDSSVTQTYDMNNNALALATRTSYSYANLYNLSPTSSVTYNSKGDAIEDHKSYPHDAIAGLSTDAAAAQTELINRWQIDRVLEETTKKNGNLLSTSRTNYAITPDNNVLPSSVQTADYANPLDTRIVFNKYDLKGNINDMQKANDMLHGFLWDYTANYPVAKVENASVSQIAYTSFEADGTGNWTIGSSARDNSHSITGSQSYVLNSDISKSGLNSTTTYIVSYWSQNNTSPYAIAGTLSGYPMKGKMINGWTLYVHKITGQTSITISGSGSIDELRLYPATAQMTTYTYNPLVGMTSQCDPGNRITYFEYDALQRLKRVRDQDYNILKTYDYQYQVSSNSGN